MQKITKKSTHLYTGTVSQAWLYKLAAHKLVHAAHAAVMEMAWIDDSTLAIFLYMYYQ